MKRVNQNVNSLFARAGSARTVMNGPSMAAVMGMGRPAAYAALGGFSGGFGGLGAVGALPDFQSDVGRGQSLLNQILGELQGAITQAKATQADVAPALTRPEGAQLASTVQALEGAIESDWKALVSNLNQYGQRLATLEAVSSTNESTYSRNGYSITWAGAPSVNYFQSKGFTMDDYNAAGNAYAARVASAQNDVNAAQSYIGAKKSDLAARLNKYNVEVPKAASLVQAQVVAEVKARTAVINLESAKQALTQAGTDTQSFVAQAQLDALRRQAADAARAAADAAARASSSAKAVAAGTGSWKYLLGGAVVLGVGVYLLKRKK